MKLFLESLFLLETFIVNYFQLSHSSVQIRPHDLCFALITVFFLSDESSTLPCAF